MQNVVVVRVVTFILLVAVFLVNGLVPYFRVNNTDTGEVSARNENFLTPEGYAFSIWGVIYFFLAVYGINQLIPSTYNSKPLNVALGVLPIINFVLNCAWIVVWQYEQIVLAFVIMLGLLVTLSIIYIRLDQRFTPAQTYWEYITVHLGFRLYFSWILVASFVNLWVISAGVGSEYVTGAYVGYVLLTVLACGIALAAVDPVPAGVAGWALMAIHKKWENWDGGPHIGRFALVCSILCLVVHALLLLGIIIANQVYNARPGWNESTNNHRTFLGLFQNSRNVSDFDEVVVVPKSTGALVSEE